MKTLVIHPHDPSTGFLSEIYEGKDWTIIDEPVSKSFLKNAIKSHDRIIMLGHGTHQGLLSGTHFVIDSNFVYLLREKKTVCIWCNADEFVAKYKLKGIFTGMIISEWEEAVLFSVDAHPKEIWESNEIFAFAMKIAIESDDPVSVAKELYKGDSQVFDFNRQRIFEIKEYMLRTNGGIGRR